MSQKPKPQEAKQKLLKAIQNNEKADWLLYEALKDAIITIGPTQIKVYSNLSSHLKEYAEVYLTLTSLEGRKYVKEHLDELLDYLEVLVKSEG